MSVTLGGLNTNFFATSNEIISGSELTQVSREILSAAPTATSVQSTDNLPKINFDKLQRVDNGLKVFGSDSNLDAQTVKQIATNQAGLDIQLSQKALSAIETLKAQAAKLQTANMPQAMDGKVYVPTQIPETTDLKSIFSLNSAPQLFETTNLSKEKKGSSSLFSFSGNNNNEENNQERESLSIFA